MKTAPWFLLLHSVTFVVALSCQMKVFAEDFVVQPEKSTIKWIGKKVFKQSQHDGTVGIQGGEVKTRQGKLTYAMMTVDMKSIVNLDLQNAKFNKMLVSHLQSDDFFAVDQFPEAKIELTTFKDLGGGKYQASGQLTIRQNTKPVKLELTDVSIKEKTASAKAALTFNRKDFGITYNSHSDFVAKVVKIAKDKVIDDMVSIAVMIEAQRKTGQKG